MENKINNREMVKEVTNSEKNGKNIDYLINSINTFEIMELDVEDVFNSEYLRECVGRLETDEYHIEQSIRTIKERIEEIELNSQREEEVKMN